MTPFSLPRRTRLARLLHAKGFRDAERMREDEVQAALARLDALSSIATRAHADRLPSSTEKMGAGKNAPPVVDDRALYDDPDALPRFREPKIFLPEGDRTFLRLVAVDGERLFATWDLDAKTRARTERGCQLELHVLDDDRPPTRHDVDARTGGWYLQSPGERLAVLVRLVDENGELVVESNPAVIPATRPATPGPLVFATLPPFVDRRTLAHGPLLDGRDLPKGIERTAGGEAFARPVAVLSDDGHESDVDSPSSAERARARALADQSNPSSTTLAKGAEARSASSVNARGGRP